MLNWLKHKVLIVIYSNGKTINNYNTTYIYEYDRTDNNKFDKVLKQMAARCFIYTCHKCFKPWNNCPCYCHVCKTYLRYCHQILYDEMGTYEDDLAIIIPLGL